MIFQFYKSNNTSQNIVDSLKEQLTENKIKTIISLGVDLTRHIEKFKEIAKDTNIISSTKYKNELTNLSNITISQRIFLKNGDYWFLKKVIY